VVAVGHLFDELVRSDGAGGLFDLRHRRIGPAQGDVLAYRATEQVRLLGHHDDGATQIGRGQVAYVDPVQSHVPVGGVVEPGDELGYRGLSRAGGADQGDRLTGRDVQVEVWQHRRAVAVL